MEQSFTFSERDEGKRVIDASGDRIGVIADVRGGTAYVNPNAGLADTIVAKLGWDSMDEDTYPLNASKVREITDDEIRLTSYDGM